MPLDAPLNFPLNQADASQCMRVSGLLEAGTVRDLSDVTASGSIRNSSILFIGLGQFI